MLNVTHKYFSFAIRCTIFQQMPCFASKVREQMPCFAFKDFLPIFYKCLLYIHGQVQNVAANAPLCTQNIQNENAWNPNFLGKSWTEALFCIHRLWINALIRIQDDGTNGLLLQMPSFTFRLFEQSLLCIQNVRTNPFASYPRFLKQFCFSSKVFEQMPWFASKMWANNFLRIQNVWTGAFSCTQNVRTRGLGAGMIDKWSTVDKWSTGGLI